MIENRLEQRDLEDGEWLNPPVATKVDGKKLIVTTALESDFWRETSYGFIHESGHALLNDFPNESSIELSWILDYNQQFDQAGIFIYSDEKNWIKAGIEFADGAPQLGAVVTMGKSDWSVAPVSEWMGHEVHLRISRSNDAITIRAKSAGEWKLVRLAPLDPSRQWRAGLHAASPTRAGLAATFTSIKVGPADSQLH
jgi:regulation of enolase protein 1 (concanavalin A-like superfamily)